MFGQGGHAILAQEWGLFHQMDIDTRISQVICSLKTGGAAANDEGVFVH